jgi:hypothetical protein
LFSGRQGEIDWIGGRRCACFLEGKTPTLEDVKPAEAAVDRAQETRDYEMEMAREYRKELPLLCQWIREIVSVYYVGISPQIDASQNASLTA